MGGVPNWGGVLNWGGVPKLEGGGLKSGGVPNWGGPKLGGGLKLGGVPNRGGSHLGGHGEDAAATHPCAKVGGGAVALLVIG